MAVKLKLSTKIPSDFKLGFGTFSWGKPSECTDDQLNELALLAQQSQDPTLLGLFDTLPTIEELTSAKGEKVIAETKPATPASGTPAVN